MKEVANSESAHRDYVLPATVRAERGCQGILKLTEQETHSC